MSGQSPPSPPPLLRALLEAADALVSRSSSARIAIARLNGVIDPAGLPAFLREEVGAEIARAYANTTEPLSARDVERALKNAWGDPVARVLDEFDPEPLAVRPHTQVHRGVLDGERVAVKLARPGVASLTRADLSLLTALAAPIGAAFPAADPGAILREVRERVLDELDLEHEGDMQRRVARASRSLPGVEVARVFGERTNEAVLVTELIEAPTLDAPGTLSNADRSAVARALLRISLGAPRGVGGVLANPRASDMALRPDGTVVLLGAGAFRVVTTTRLDAALAALTALRDADERAFVAAVSGGLAAMPNEAAAEAFALILELAGDLFSAPFLLDAALLADLGERAFARLEEGFVLARAATPDPADAWPGRMIGQLVALLARLETSEDWIALALEAAQRGWE